MRSYDQVSALEAAAPRTGQQAQFHLHFQLARCGQRSLVLCLSLDPHPRLNGATVEKRAVWGRDLTKIWTKRFLADLC